MSPLHQQCGCSQLKTRDECSPGFSDRQAGSLVQTISNLTLSKLHLHIDLQENIFKSVCYVIPPSAGKTYKVALQSLDIFVEL